MYVHRPKLGKTNNMVAINTKQTNKNKTKISTTKKTKTKGQKFINISYAFVRRTINVIYNYINEELLISILKKTVLVLIYISGFFSISIGNSNMNNNLIYTSWKSKTNNDYFSR